MEAHGTVSAWRLAITLRITDDQAIVQLERCALNGELALSIDWHDQPSYARTYQRPDKVQTEQG